MKLSYPLILLSALVFSFSIAAAQHLTSAKLYLKQLQFDKAEEAAIKAVEKDSTDGEAWFVLGKARYELRKYIGMNEAFGKALVLDAEDYKQDIQRYRFKVWADSYNAGVKYYRRGRDTASFFQTAIDSFKVAMQVLPESTMTYYVCALSYFGNNQVDEAIKTLNKGLDRDPNKPEELDLLAKLHKDLARQKAQAKDDSGAKKEYAFAATVYEKLCSLDSMNVTDVLSLIDMYELSGQSDKVFPFISSAVSRDKNNTTFLYIYGIYLVKQEKYPEGIEQLLKVVQAKGDSTNLVYSDAVYNLGVAYLNWGVGMKKVSDSIADVKIKEKKKDFKEDLSYKEKFKAAIPYFEKAAELKKDDAVLWQQLGRLYANLNMPDKANAAFKKVDELNK